MRSTGRHGTTRDSVSQELVWKGDKMIVADTAGIRKASADGAQREELDRMAVPRRESSAADLLWGRPARSKRRWLCSAAGRMSFSMCKISRFCLIPVIAVEISGMGSACCVLGKRPAFCSFSSQKNFTKPKNHQKITSV